MPALPYDPLLKKASKDIEKILKKHNIGGAYVLTSVTHAEFAIHEPTWAGLILNNNSARIKVDAEAYPDPLLKKEVAENTAHFIYAIDRGLEVLATKTRMLKGLISKVWDVTVEAGEITPHHPDMDPDMVKKGSEPPPDNVKSLDQQRAKKADD